MGPYVGLVVFTLLVWSVYVLFVDAAPAVAARRVGRHLRFLPRLGPWLRRLDWLRVHRFEGSSRPEVLAEAGVTAEEASEEIKVRVGARTSAALRPLAILESLPVGFLWARALTLPPISWLGSRGVPARGAARHCLLPRNRVIGVGACSDPRRRFLRSWPPVPLALSPPGRTVSIGPLVCDR